MIDGKSYWFVVKQSDLDDVRQWSSDTNTTPTTADFSKFLYVLVDGDLAPLFKLVFQDRIIEWWREGDEHTDMKER